MLFVKQEHGTTFTFPGINGITGQTGNIMLRQFCRGENNAEGLYEGIIKVITNEVIGVFVQFIRGANIHYLQALN